MNKGNTGAVTTTPENNIANQSMAIIAYKPADDEVVAIIRWLAGRR